MKTQVKKEMKKYPYKSRDISNLLYNLPRTAEIKKAMENYAIVDSKGKIIETFRTKAAAMNHLRERKRNYFGEEVKIVGLKDGEW